MSLLVIFALICSLFSYKKKVFEKRLYYLLLLPIFSKIILKSELFRHQILSLFLSVIGIIILFISKALQFDQIDIIFNILLIFSSTARSLLFVMVKHLTHKYFLSIYLCLLYIGFFSVIILLLGFIIFYLISDDDLGCFIKNFEGEDFLSATYLILIFISSLIENILLFLIIFYFSPTLVMVTDIINPIIYWILALFQNEKENENKNKNKALVIILNSIGYFLVLFCSLIYNEFVIFNFYGLNKNTKKYFDKKQREELLSIIDDHIDDEPIESNNEID